MNKSDLCLIFVSIVIIICSLFMFSLFKNNSNLVAIVYYDNKELMQINMKKDNIYNIAGYNGNVKLIVKDGKIKVDEENSPRHICSKQGFISESYETIVCLPNKIMIKIESRNEYDTVVG